MEPKTQTHTYSIRNSEKCFRFKPEAFENHAPQHKGIYELVTFDDQQNPQVLYVGAALTNSVYDCLVAHSNGSLKPAAQDIMAQHPNLYFDYLIELQNVKTQEDAQDVYWWLVNKYKPPYNDIENIKPSRKPGEIDVIELE